uniref:Cytoplasmic protein n=1 Tax=Chlorobium chlorochromatii (strain CaD3) TaxID=340177 RepID=Q3AS86_CHLCH
MNYQQLLALFKETHCELQHKAARSVDTALVIRNWLFGWYIVEFEQGGAERTVLYGKSLINRLSQELKSLGLKGISPTSLKQCRTFYLAYEKIGQALPDQCRGKLRISEVLQALPAKSENELPEIQQALPVISFEVLHNIPQIVHELSTTLAGSFKLGWTHYVALLTISNADERSFYEIEAYHNSWGARELERQIAASLFERLALSRDKEEICQLAQKGQVVEKATDIIKNPFVLEFLGLEEKSSYSEHALETAIINHLEHFLLELGKGFLFEARQKRFTFDNDHFYVDLVFYNRLLRCYVLIDLKRDKLTHQDLGQMQMYVNYFDRYVKTDDELPTIGIVLCHRKNDALVELTLPKDSNIFASKYQLYLPSKEELKRELEEAAGIKH